jgi:hypothetical protein
LDDRGVGAAIDTIPIKKNAKAAMMISGESVSMVVHRDQLGISQMPRVISGLS